MESHNEIFAYVISFLMKINLWDCGSQCSKRLSTLYFVYGFSENENECLKDRGWTLDVVVSSVNSSPVVSLWFVHLDAIHAKITGASPEKILW